MKRLNPFDLDISSFQDGRFRFLTRKTSNDKSIVSEVTELDCYGIKEFKDQPFNRILDLGGHIGSFAVYAASTWRGARVVSFEPLPNNQQLFEINTGGYENITLVKRAVVDKPESHVEFVVSDHDSQRGGEHNSGGGRLLDIKDSDSPNEHNERIKVGAVSITDVFDEYGPFDFIKMDIEDAESSLLHALCDADMIKDIRYLRGEFHRDNFLADHTRLFPRHVFGGYYVYTNMGYFYANPKG